MADPSVSSDHVVPGVAHYVGLVPVKDMVPNLPNTPNLRAANIKSPVAKDVAASLRSNDGNFHLKNKGVTMLATSVAARDGGWDVVITVTGTTDPDGILDGGHTYAVICDALAANAPIDKQYVFVNIRTNVPGVLRAQIAEALNRTTAVSSGSLLNRLGEFEWIKQALGSAADNVAWRQNDEGVKVEELVARLYACNICEGVEHHKAYSSRGSTLSAYRKNPEILTSHRNAAADILWIYEQIVFSLAGEAERRLGRRAVTAVGSQAPLMDTSYASSKLKLVRGIAMPVLSALRACLIDTADGVRFNRDRATMKALLTILTDQLFDKIAEHWEAVGSDPGALGKREAVWRDLHAIVESASPIQSAPSITHVVDNPAPAATNAFMYADELAADWGAQLEERREHLQALREDAKDASGTQVATALASDLANVARQIEVLEAGIALTQDQGFGICFNPGCDRQVGVNRITDPLLAKWCQQCAP
jgi:hypothetical protein